MTDPYVGAPVRRREDRRLLTGRGRYTDDATPARALHVVFVRGAHAHARIASIDTGPARAMPGVVSVVTAADIEALNASALTPQIPGAAVPTKSLLARDTVLYVGDPVAAVLAVDQSTAVDAAEQVLVEYDPLPANVDPERALEADVPVLHEEAGSNLAFRFVRGSDDIEAALSAADTVARVRLPGKRLSATPLEPRAFVAAYDAQTDGLVISLGTQMLHGSRTTLARALGLGEHRFVSRCRRWAGPSVRARLCTRRRS